MYRSITFCQGQPPSATCRARWRSLPRPLGWWGYVLRGETTAGLMIDRLLPRAAEAIDSSAILAIASCLIGSSPPRSISIYRREGLRKFGARHDAELWVNAVQVSAHSAMGQEQPVRDLPIGKAVRRKLGDP
jgi:hypothetical protein